MTENEKKLKIEVEKLKNENETLKKENKNLEIQKKTFQNKLKDALELIKNLQKENNTQKCEKLKLEVKSLKEQVASLNKKLSEKETIVQNLKIRINKDSSNSSKPPSTDDIYKKKVHINNNRQKGGKNGGQYGHTGHTLSEDYIKELIKEGKVKHVVKDIGDATNQNYKSKYFCDIETTLVVTEYRFHADADNDYNIPKEMQPVVQYGPYSKSIMMYLNMEMMCPLNKTAIFMQRITKNIFKYSEGTIVNTQKALDKKLEPLVEQIKQLLIAAKVLHADESGVRINGKLEWIHTYCTRDLVFYAVNEKRGTEAINEIGILAYFVNILVHDHWKSYYKNSSHMTHAECNAHILRYLKSIFEIAKVEEVEALIKLFVQMNEEKKIAIENGETCLPEERLEFYEKEYDRFLLSWGKNLKKRMSKSTNIKQFDDERNLQERLVEFKENHLLFIKDFDVPFDNNPAERSIRIWKSKINVSGGFRTEEGAKIFANARSFLTTCNFRGENTLEKLIALFSGEEYKLV